MERLNRIDHLRAIAALLVVNWHFVAHWPNLPGSDGFLLSIFRQGSTGVSFFCVLSGFILTTIYGAREYSVKTYYANRLLRIAPLFLLFTALSFYVGDWDVVQLIATNLTGLSRGGLPSYIGPGWTVLIEFQFYLLFPFLLTFSQRYGLKYLAGWLVLLWALRFAVWTDKGTVQLVAYYSIFGRMDQFVVGMFLGALLKDDRVNRLLSQKAISLPLFAIGVGSAMAFFGWYNSQGGLLKLFGQPWPSQSILWVFMPLIEALIYGLITAAYLHVPAPPFMAWPSATLSYVGVISYSIYLDHLIVFLALQKAIDYYSFAPQSWPECFMICTFIVFPVLCGIATITYYVVELPFMRLRKSKR